MAIGIKLGITARQCWFFRSVKRKVTSEIPDAKRRGFNPLVDEYFVLLS